jgi:hypothetical protein
MVQGGSGARLTLEAFERLAINAPIRPAGI